MRERAVVVSNKGSLAKVEIVRSSACDHCRGCEVGTRHKTIEVWANNPLKAQVGQTVEIELEAATMLTATFIVYVIPLIAFFVGIALGYNGAGFYDLASREIFSLIVGLAAMGVSYYGIHIYNNKVEKTQEYASKIVNIIK